MKLTFRLLKVACQILNVLYEIHQELKDIKELQMQIQPALNQLIKPLKEDKWISSNQVCELLGITTKTLYNHTVKGILKSCKRGGRHYYRESDVLKLN